MPNMETILDLLRKTNAVYMNDHFVYTSGKHGSVYINKDALYPHTDVASAVGALFAEKFKDSSIDVVVAPALGGIVLSQWTAHHLSHLTGREVLGVYTEKTPDKNQILTRGYDTLVAGKNILIVEDTTMTGGSVKKVVDTVRAAGGNVVAVSAMINRDPVNVTSESLGAPFSPLGILEAEAFDADTCPLCKQNIPINMSVGKGKSAKL